MAATSTTRTAQPSAGLMFLFTVLSWLGEYVHNLFELPQLSALSPENSIPAMISLSLFVMWLLTPFKRAAVTLLLAWALLHLVGGAIITVIPFGFLPFYPEQTIDHYAAHALYGLAQLPLIALAARLLRAR
jgi:hypothetical protein